MGEAGPVRNILTFDLEEYFQVSGFEHAVSPDDWSRLESRVEPQAERVLQILDQHGVRATFFVLGMTAERHPGLVREIVRRGHEVASHGFGHQLLYRRGPRSFRRDLRRSLRLLERITGGAIHGFRAPSFSVVRETLWALPILAEEGIRYDSSIFPIRHDRYGIPGAPPIPSEVHTEGGMLIELPPLTRKLLIGRFAAGGGGWLRLFPLAWTVSAVRRMNRGGHPAVLYLHPWELDPDQPRIPGVRRTARLRHFVGMRRTEGKLRRLLESFPFGTAAEYLGLPAREPVAVRPARLARLA